MAKEKKEKPENFEDPQNQEIPEDHSNIQELSTMLPAGEMRGRRFSLSPLT